MREILDKYHKLSPTTFDEFYEMLEMVEVAKGEDFIKRGHVEGYEYFVLDGVCRSYLLNPEGEEVTISFFAEKSVLSPWISRTDGRLSRLNFQALTDVHLARFSAKAFEEFMVVNLEIRAWGNEALKRELALKVEREIQLASLNAKGRLLKFREQFPLLENLVPHPAIASYLGITNVSLSRLRKETL